MQSTIRFSLFGNYEKFSTSNLEVYMKLIAFWGQKGYKPSTANELQLQPNGQVKTLIMPTFLYDDGIIIEISSNRINFQKVSNIDDTLIKLNEAFVSELLDLTIDFADQLGISANRVALNCDIMKNGANSHMPAVTSYFDTSNMTEMNVRNAARKVIEGEETNIILEKYVNTKGNVTKYSYDINSVASNYKMRFDKSNIRKMYEAYINIGLDIEKGMKA